MVKVVKSATEAARLEIRQGEAILIAGYPVNERNPWEDARGNRVSPSDMKELSEKGGVLIIDFGHKRKAYAYIGGTLQSLSSPLPYTLFLEHHIMFL